jgi:glycerophosphoryl diester phosphodiesterase
MSIDSHGAGAPLRKRPMVCGHRGAPVLRPEHTLASYAQAIADGADSVEPDLVCSKDGVLVARHEPDISDTTDVADRPEFASRRRTLSIDGHEVTGWFTIDFTLDELKSLRCKERLGPKRRPESARYDGQFQIVTWEELIDFVAAESAARGRLIGLVPELKSSTWHRTQGHPLDERFFEITARHAYPQTAPLMVESFEIDSLKLLRAKFGHPSNMKLVQLVEAAHKKPVDGGGLTYGQMTTPEGFAAIRRYAEVVAPNLRSVIPLTAEGELGEPTRFVADAHAAGLEVVVWTFRPENRFLPKDLRSAAGKNARNPAGSLAEMRRFIDLGVDGFFTDDPALGRQAVDAA